MAGSIMVKFTKPGRLIAQTSYLGRFKPLKMFGKSSKKIVKVYRRILDLAHCVLPCPLGSAQLRVWDGGNLFWQQGFLFRKVVLNERSLVPCGSGQFTDFMTLLLLWCCCVVDIWATCHGTRFKIDSNVYKESPCSPLHCNGQPV